MLPESLTDKLIKFLGAGHLEVTQLVFQLSSFIYLIKLNSYIY